MTISTSAMANSGSETAAVNTSGNTAYSSDTTTSARQPIISLADIVTYLICSRISIGLVPTILIRGVICMIVPNAIYFLVFRKTEEYNQALHLADNMTKGKVNRVLVKLGMN